MSAEEIAVNPHKRLIHNALFSSLSWFLPVILTVVATRIVIKGLGYEQYGIYALIIGFVNYSFTFGVGRAVTKYVAEYNNSGDENSKGKISEVISISFWLSLVLSLTGSLVVAVFSEPIIADVLQINAELHDLAIKSLYIACTTIGFLMIGQVFQAVLQGIHRFGRISLLVTASGFLLNLGNIVLVFGGNGFFTLLVWNLFLTAANALVYYYLSKRYLPDYSLNFKFKKETVKTILSYGSGVFGYQIFANALLIFERVLITRNLGAENLTFYVIPMMLALYMHAFVSSIVVVIFPLVSELQNDREKLHALYRRATKIIFSMVIFIIVSLLCCGNAFLTLWINQEFAQKSFPILVTLTLSFGVISFLCIVWQIAEGFGQPRFNALISLIWFAASAPLMLWLVSPLGNFGVSVGRLTAHLLTLPFIFIGEKIFLKEMQWRFWLRVTASLLLCALFAAAFEILIFYIFGINWLVLMTSAAGGFIVYLLILFGVKLFTPEEMRFFRAMLPNFTK